MNCSRQREIAVRAALGASALRLARQFLTESLLLASLGGTAGILLSVWGVHFVGSLNLSNVPRLDHASLNPQVLLYSVAITILTGVLFGLAPIWRVLRPEVASTLKQDDKGSSSWKRTAAHPKPIGGWSGSHRSRFSSQRRFVDQKFRKADPRRFLE